MIQHSIYKKIRLPLGCFLIGVFLFFLGINYYIATAFDTQIYFDPDRIPGNRVGLVLGTSRSVAGRPNLYYLARLAAASDLYHAGKIEKILVSGDNSLPGYDEPTDMKNDLIALGVTAEDIYLDYAGFRTLDSIVRGKAIFGLKSVTIISQPFHCERALFLAKHKGVQAIGFAARDIDHPTRILLEIREAAARFKAALDIWLLNTEPKFLGTPVEID